MKTIDSWGPDTRLPKKLEKGTVLVWMRAGCTGASLKACLVQRCRITTMRTTLYHLHKHTQSDATHPLIFLKVRWCGRTGSSVLCSMPVIPLKLPLRSLAGRTEAASVNWWMQAQ